jgi:CHAD domain-containing protein
MAKRRRQAARLARKARKFEQSKLVAELDQIRDKLSRFVDSEDLLEHARRQITQLASRFPAHRKIKPRGLHALRIDLKMIRYLVEACPESDDRDRFVTSLKAVQDAIGAWRDWEELASSARKKFRDRANCPLVEEIRGLLAVKHMAALSSARLLFASYAAQPSRKPAKAVNARSALAQHAG